MMRQWYCTCGTWTNRCGVNELLNNVCPFDDGELPQDIADHPESESIEQLNALFYTRRFLARLGSMGIQTELPDLQGGHAQGGA